MLVDDTTFLDKKCYGYRGGEHRFILNHMASDTRIMARTRMRANVMMLSVMMMSITGRCADPEKR